MQFSCCCIAKRLMRVDGEVEETYLFNKTMEYINHRETELVGDSTIRRVVEMT